jgi:hypothetical protein
MTDTDLVQVIEENHLDKVEADAIKGSFVGFLDSAEAYREKAMAIVITSIDQKDEMKEARRIRLELKGIRTNAENVRKQLKEDIVRKGKAIDGIANIVKAITIPLEEHLEEQEKFIERLEAEEREKLENERVALLSPYVEDVSFYNLREMSQQGFEQLLETSKLAKAKREEDKIKAEKERIAAEKKAAAEQEKIRKENAKLKDEADKKQAEIDEANRKLKEKEDAEKAEADRKAKEAEEDEKMKKGAEYKAFLAKNGCTEESKHLFHIQTTETEVKLYRIVDTFKIK